MSTQEQEIFKARCRLLCMMGDLMRQAAHQRELENLAEKERRMSVSYFYGKRCEVFGVFSCGLNASVYNRSYWHREGQQSTAAAAGIQVLQICIQ